MDNKKNKGVLKITKEQYDRIFTSGLINSYKNIGKLKITIEQYNRLHAAGIITEKLAALPIQVKTPSVGVGSEIDDSTKHEMLELLKYMYRENKKLSPFWEQNGLSYDDIKNSLLEKGIIVEKDGKCKLSKNLGNKELAKKAFEEACLELIGSGGSVSNANVETPEMEMDEAVYSDEFNPNDPTRQPDATLQSPTQPTNNNFEVIGDNTNELAILKDQQGNLYSFYFGDADLDKFKQYANVQTFQDNQGDLEYGDFTLDDETLGRYVNDNIGQLKVGHGYNDFESGQFDLVQIDDELKQDLIRMYDKDKYIVQALGGGVDEGVMWADTYQDINPEPKRRTNPENQAILDKLRSLKQPTTPATQHPLDPHPEDLEEMTSCGSVGGSFTAPLNFTKEEPVIKKQIPVVAENTTAVSAGKFQYDANALPGIKGDGTYKTPKKSKAETTPQWAGGSFPEQPECSKPNNNKEAQNGKCNSGASSLKLKKAKGSINAPSLGENTIYEIIANQTGKSMEEVKQIIESKTKKL